MNSILDNVKFLHPVGASTFKYGVTIPVEAQTERMCAIAKGGKVPVTILFGTEEPVIAEIRTNRDISSSGMRTRPRSGCVCI